MERCRWCGRWLARGTEPTTRSILGAHQTQWRTVQQLLCPEHSQAWSLDAGWNREADWTLPLEVLR